MKRFLLFCLTIIAALSMRASVVSFDFSSQTSLTELGLTIPSSARPSTVFPDSISYQGITMTNNSSLNQIRLENGSDMVYSFRMYSQTRVVISSATPITAIQVEWYSSAYGNNIAELTDGAWYGSSYSVTLNAYLGDNYISKITVTTEDATGTDPTGTGTTPETGSAIQVGDFYYEIQDYGYGAFAELVRVPGTTGYASYTNLSGDITIPGSITYNGTSYQVRAIEYQALNGSGISSVTVEEGVEYIYNFAFMDCSSLTTVTLPSTISYMGNQVFGWSGLKTLTINATTPPIHGEREYCLMDASYVEHIYVPASSVAAYKADTVWANHASIIEAIPSSTTTDPTTPTTEPLTVTWDSINGLTTIDISQYTNYNFGGEIETFNDPNFVSKEIEGVTATVSATVDGSYARVLTYEGNTSISVSGGGTLTFSSPELPIQSIVINFDPDKGVVNVNSASDWTVTAGDATSIQVSQVIWSGTPTYSVVLEDAYISHITSIVFTFASGTGTDPGTGTTPETGSIIQVGDFYYEIKDYGDGLYAELVKVPGSDEFASYTNLSGDITIPGSITYGGADYPVSGVGYMSLTGSSAITSVTIGEGVGYIHNFAFMNCSSLTTATLPSTVTSMGNQVFGWSGLKTITINAITPPYVMSDEDPFKDASYVEHIYVPASSVDAYKAASVWSNHASIIEAIPSGTTTDDPTGEAKVPTASDLLNAGFNPRANVVLALYFDVAPCNDVVLAGSYAQDETGGWIMDPDQLAHFTRVEGFDGWYAAEVPYANTSINVKPVQLMSDSSFNWNYQAGDADAWIYKGGDQLSISSNYAGEADVTIPSLGAYIYELAYWKNGNTPCADKSHNYTIYLMAPQCETVQPGIYGELNNWEGTPMTQTTLDGQEAYVCQVKAAEGSTFMFSDVKMGGDNGILYFDASNNEWNYLEEITLPQASSDTTLFFDFSSLETYQWADCQKNIKQYTVILIAPECDSVTPAIIGTFDGWKGTRMRETSYGDKKAYMYQVSDEPGSAFKFFDAVRGWDNEIQYYDSISGWLGMNNYEFPNIEADTATLVYDLSDASMYCWALCKPEPTPCYQVITYSDTVCSNEGVYYLGDHVLYYEGTIDTTVYEGGYSLRRHEEHQSFQDTVRTADGCEDIYVYDIVWMPSKTSVMTYRMEEGDSIHIGGRFVTESGIYNDSVKDVYGCDSTYEYNVIVYRMTYDTINAAICQGEVYEFRGNAWSRAGSYRTTSAQGDTTFIINLTVYPTQYTSEFWPIYEGNPIVIGDRRYEQPGVYDDTLKSILGCDSIIRVYIEYARYHIDLSSNNYDFGRVRGDTMVVWPDSTATFQAVPYDGYVFSKWSDGNTENPRTVTVQQDMAFTAIFKPFKYSITVVAEDPTMGTVMGGGTYLPNEQVTIMATPYKDCEFVQWSDGNKLNPRSFRAQGDSVYTAVFHRELPPEPVICSDTMFFTSADTALLATRVYAASEIEPYDKLIIATVDNKNVMGPQFVEDGEVRNFRTAVEYTEKMNISNVSIVEVVPNNGNYRLRVADGQLAPRCEDCTSSTNQLYATEIGADWYFAEYDSVVVPEALGYDNRMILYNDESMRFSSYRQLTSVDRRQTTVFKLHTKRDIPVEPVIIVEDTTAWQEEEPAMDSIQVDVVPQDTVAVISTPHVDYVYSFTLIIWADEAHTEVLLIITYDAEGTQISVTRPSAVRRLPAVSTDITFQINELKPSQTYHYTLVACEDDGSILTSLNSSFMTTSEPTPMGINSLLDSQDETVKLIYNGQLFILRNGKWYNALGVQVK